MLACVTGRQWADSRLKGEGAFKNEAPMKTKQFTLQSSQLLSGF